jgi:hypothetical protein
VLNDLLRGMWFDGLSTSEMNFLDINLGFRCPIGLTGGPGELYPRLCSAYCKRVISNLSTCSRPKLAYVTNADWLGISFIRIFDR